MMQSVGKPMTNQSKNRPMVVEVAATPARSVTSNLNLREKQRSQKAETENSKIKGNRTMQRRRRRKSNRKNRKERKKHIATKINENLVIRRVLFESNPWIKLWNRCKFIGCVFFHSFFIIRRFHQCTCRCEWPIGPNHTKKKACTIEGIKLLQNTWNVIHTFRKQHVQVNECAWCVYIMHFFFYYPISFSHARAFVYTGAHTHTNAPTKHIHAAIWFMLFGVPLYAVCNKIKCSLVHAPLYIGLLFFFFSCFVFIFVFIMIVPHALPFLFRIRYKCYVHAARDWCYTIHKSCASFIHCMRCEWEMSKASHRNK